MAFTPAQVLYLNDDNDYGADELGLPYRDLIGEGIVGSADFAVTQRAAGANMSVDVAAGACWVKGDDDANLQPTYRYREAATTNVAVTAADATDPRVDRVVAEILDDTFSGVSKLGRIRVIAGTPTTGATLTNLSGAAAVPNNALLLANVLVGAGASSVSSANISDQRRRAQVGGGSAQVSAARVRRSTNQSIPNSAATVVTFDTTESDSDGLFNGTDSITIKTPGWYAVTAQVRWAVNATGAREAFVTKNGTRILDDVKVGTSDSVDNNATTLVELAAGDVLKLNVFQSSGGALNITGITTAPVLAVARLG